MPWDLKNSSIGIGGWMSESARWSNLRRLGSSGTMKLMILMPIIGYILVFNKNILSFLELYEPISIKYGISLGGDTGSGVSNLVFLYFGFLFLGVAAILYHICSPIEVSQHDSAPDYVRYIDSIASDLIVGQSLDNLLRMYIYSGNDEELSGFSRYSPFSFPENMSQRIHAFASDVFEASDILPSGGQIEGGETDDIHENDGFSDFYTGSGYINTYKVLSTMYQAPKVIWAWSIPLRQEAVKRKYDVLFMEYEALNYSSFYIRFTIIVLFVLGYTLVAVPTIKTASKILMSILS